MIEFMQSLAFLGMCIALLFLPALLSLAAKIFLGGVFDDCLPPSLRPLETGVGGDLRSDD